MLLVAKRRKDQEIWQGYDGMKRKWLAEKIKQQQEEIRQQNPEDECGNEYQEYNQHSDVEEVPDSENEESGRAVMATETI